MMLLNEEKLLILAIAENAKSVVAEIMNSIMAEYLEGEMDDARLRFNKFWHILSKDMKHKVLHTCVFEATANSLARKNDIPEPWKQVGEFKWEYIGTEKNPYDRA